jgi:LysM domain
LEDDMSSAPAWDVDATEWVTDGCRLTATGVAPVIPLQRTETGRVVKPTTPARRRPRRAGARGPRYHQPAVSIAPATVRLTRRGELLIRRVTAAMVVLAVAGVLISLAVGVVGLLRPADRTYETVVVQPGQSLWQIAAQHRVGGDVRDEIERIRSANRLSGADIQAGQRLIIPVG